jgi:CRP/FNR family transcriptional regulator, cyclic AMP receptor protein
MSATDLLKGCPLFYELYDSEIAKIIKKSRVSTFQSGEYIIKEGESGTELYIIVLGKASIRKVLNGKEVRLIDLSRGDLFGEMVIINELERTASVVADTECDILRISYNEIYALFKNQTQIFSLLILNLARLLTKRLKTTNIKLEEEKMNNR